MTDRPKERVARERWKKVPGWPYEVSDQGKVRRIGSESLMKQQPRGTGVCPQGTRYQRVILSNKGERWCAGVHQLVLLAFVGPCPDGHHSHHKNHLRDDNRLENLGYLPAAENISQKGETNTQSKMSREDVVEARTIYDPDVHTIVELARKYGVSRPTMRETLQGVWWSHLDPPKALALMEDAA